MLGYKYTIDLCENNVWKNMPLKYASFCLFRKVGGEPSFYFVKNDTFFTADKLGKTG